MKKFILTTILLTILVNSNLFAQTTKKEATNYYRKISRLDTSEIMQGRHLELATEFSIKKFISYYIHNGKTQDTKKSGMLTILPLYSDSNYTYFVRKTTYYIEDFIKVNTNELRAIDYEKLDGVMLRKKFIEEIIPEADKLGVARREKGCTTLYENPEFNYDYLRDSQEILITYKWKITCDFFFNVINKTYTTRLDIETMTFKN